MGEYTVACSPTLFFYFNLRTNLLFTTFILLDFVFLFSLQDDLNLTSLQVQPGPFNHTIQSFVKDYVDEYVGLYNLTVLFVLISKATFHFCLLHLTHLNMDSSLLLFHFQLVSTFPRHNHNLRLITALFRTL